MDIKKLLLFALFPLFLFAKVQTTYLVVEGSGHTRSSAVRNALIEAIKQTKGVAISARRAYVKSIKEMGVSIDGQSSHGVAISQRSAKRIQEATRGFIRGYRVVDSYKEGGEWIVKVKIKMLKYKSPGLNPRKRRSLAVLPFEYKSSYFLDGIKVGGKALSKRITQSIINKITQTRKFTVLDRENSKYYQFEKSFLTSGDVDHIELARLGKRLGCDYFVIGQILDFGVSKNTKSNYYTGEVNTKNSAYATISYRILNIPTQQIKWSDTIDIDFKLPPTRRAESLIVKAGDRIAQVLVDQIMFNIYPPKIISVRHGIAIINMGGNVLHRGDIFEVYALGKKLYDPYTKEYLGRDETEIGKIEITKVRPKISYAKTISGAIQRGALLRRAQTKTKEQKEIDGEKDSMFDMMFHK